MTAGTVLEVHPRGRATSAHRILPAQVHGHPRNCNCFDCCNLAAAWAANRRRQKGYGTWQPFVDADPARAHVEMVHDTGIAYRQIARQADMTLWELHCLRRGDHKEIRPWTAAALLAVLPTVQTLDPKAFLPSQGVARRLQALRAHGWPNPELAWRCNRSLDTLSRIFRSPYVWASTHWAVTELYEDLHDQDPIRHGVEPWKVKRGINYARKHRWAPPSGWDDIDADKKPKTRNYWGIHYAKQEPGARSDAVIEQTAELAEQGETREQIAKRVGITWDAIARTHSRADMDVPLTADVRADEDAA